MAAATLTDLQAEDVQLQAGVTAMDTVVDSAIVALNGRNAQLVALQAQLDAAIAANNPAAIQAVSDTMTAVIADNTTRTASLAAAVAAGTGAPVAQPTVTPAPTLPTP